MDSRRVLERFGLEQQTLARLDHPGIARIFDAGATDRGLPYFAMEFVDVVPIMRFVREASMPVRERLRLFFAHPSLAKQLRRGFPRSLHGAPLYLPVRNTTLRESLDRWFAANKIEPVILAEFEDRELLKTFGSGGLAAFPATAMVENEVRRQFGVERVGWVRGVRETHYAIAVQRRVMHPGPAPVCAGNARPARSG